MLGYSHATSGAVAWLAVGPVAAGLLGQQLGPTELAAGAVACAGAALIPDLDHPKATIAYTFGPVSHAVARGVALVAGGHRQMTHSLLFAVGFGLLCQAVAFAGTTPALILMFLFAAFAFRGMNIVPPKTKSSVKSIVVIAEAALLTYAMLQFMPGSWWWLGLAGFLGCVVHCLGDTCTPEGVPWAWPARWRGSVPIIAHTGNAMERVVVGPLFTVMLVVLIWVHFGQPIAKSLHLPGVG